MHLIWYRLIGSLNEIVNAVISKYSGQVDPSMLPTAAQVAEAKQTLKGKKQLASNLAPALVTPVVPTTVAPVTVHIETPGSEDSQQQQESPEAVEKPVLNSQ